MEQNITFDSGSWRSIKAMYERVRQSETMLSGKSTEDELMVYSIDEENHVLQVNVYQHNGWLRKHYFWIDDCLVEEMYEKL